MYLWRCRIKYFELELLDYIEWMFSIFNYKVYNIMNGIVVFSKCYSSLGGRGGWGYIEYLDEFFFFYNVVKVFKLYLKLYCGNKWF